MAIGDVQRITAVWELNGISMMNSWYWIQSAGIPSPPATDLLDAWEATLFPTLKAFLSVECVLACIIRKQVAPTEKPAVPTFRSIAGDIVGDSLPANAHMCISWYGVDTNPPTDTRARNSSLIAGLPEINIEKNTINNAMLVLVDTYRDTQDNDLIGVSGATYQPQVISRQQGPLFPPSYFHMDVGLIRNEVRVATRRNSVLCNPI